MSGERPKRDSGRSQGAAVVSAKDVISYIESHPSFLIDNPSLVEVLAPPGLEAGGNVHDLQQFMLARLRDEVRRLSEQQQALVETSRSNMSIQSQVHEAVLSLIEARSFEHLIHLATTDLSQILDVDVVTICVEAASDGPTGRAKTAGVFVLEPHGVDSRIGQGRNVLLANDVPADPDVFGPAAGLVQSQALARIRSSHRAPDGLLALGSRNADKFHAGQGSELLIFLANLLGRMIKGWLNLPN